ncbi:hypothetical protein HanXRQr2_Chr09g0363991 [Helianthus annuus]|uniref:Uncharacterized protein n=1 Tax=Helianthus annuus TaxID=4232 RepID=A0A251TR07_HELAN|nr:hypothetical protein HanXRQr2_Chr09g0363991 [Helianthus annuus]KAJ0532064.1 hypothetical protein HanIR_Chr09g0392571 [Helianthus annuus]KAJ0709946.1 hypothetical protein HanOQP8_Chr09g0306421 [Helianthus annuus]KAJ0891232.1 hypothetical protein HanPSC8_Chr09g0351181 [Helianthus annuus]
MTSRLFQLTQLIFNAYLQRLTPFELIPTVCQMESDQWQGTSLYCSRFWSSWIIDINPVRVHARCGGNAVDIGLIPYNTDTIPSTRYSNRKSHYIPKRMAIRVLHRSKL